jgi:hypothetical protein
VRECAIVLLDGDVPAFELAADHLEAAGDRLAEVDAVDRGLVERRFCTMSETRLIPLRVLASTRERFARM